jgi:Leucine-rich repeat (LRR) protein
LTHFNAWDNQLQNLPPSLLSLQNLQQLGLSQNLFSAEEKEKIKAKLFSTEIIF